MARRTKYTKELVAELLQILTEGNTIETACGCVGIGQETFFGWQRNKTEFAEAVQKAQKAAIRRNVGIVQVAAKKSWQAAAWWLERRHPNDYALRRPAEEVPAAKVEEYREALAPAAERVWDGVTVAETEPDAE